jgi:hypothetical protein
VNAARELREWRAVEAHAAQGDGSLEVLTPRERRFVRRVIERALNKRASRSPSIAECCRLGEEPDAAELGRTNLPTVCPRIATAHR